MPKPRVLLVSPSSAASEGNFGLPHLVALGSYLQGLELADVDIVDLDYERHLAKPAPLRVFDPSYQVIGISCYSSYDYLRAFYLGVEIRARRPDACMVVGGYHPSARPGDFTGEESPFDYVVVGEGELPLASIVRAVAAGERLDRRVLGPRPVADLDTLPPFDWTLLDRYLPVSRKIGRQVTLHLSRGCPYHCAFCMEAAKGTRSWRAFSPERAEDELRRAAAVIDFSGRPVFFTDPIFGLRRGWRTEMLERLQRMQLPVSKYWALGRIDALEPDDLDRYHAANFGLGFGLESGSETMLAIVHKGGKGTPGDYLEAAERISDYAGRIGFPWGGNVIVGHPGETPQTLRESAAYLKSFFARPNANTGFLSVDPYRFYPGSPVDAELDTYEARYGTHVYRKRWWNYSEPAFTSQWVDPSRELDFRDREALADELFAPIAAQIHAAFSYQGNADGYFRRSVEHQLRQHRPGARLPIFRDHALWRRLTGESDVDARNDPEAARLLAQQRGAVIDRLADKIELSPSLSSALREVARERFMPEIYLGRAAEDRAVPLGVEGATISAIHAYAINYGLLGLGEGDALLEFGAGTGYGVAVAAHVVGAEGRVLAYEIVSELAVAAQQNTRRLANATVRHGAGGGLEALDGFVKVLYSYAIPELPEALIEALPVGATLVAPVGTTRQVLTRVHKRPDGIELTEHGSVRYVLERAFEASSSESSSA